MTDFDSTSGLTTTYGYDNVGNRLTMQVGTATPTSYNYNELDQLRTLTTTNGSTTTINQYSYVRGNLVKVNTVGSSSVVTYTWDSANRLTGVISGSQSSAYTYDADGHRVAQTQGGTTTNYLWDSESGYGDVLLETTGTVTPVFQASYVLAGGELVSQNKGGITSYLLKDGQGSTRALFSGGSLVTSGGNQIFSYTAFGSLQTTATTVGTNYLYTGQQLDQPTGLYDLRARYYNPVDGRFLSQDKAGYDTSNPIELDRYGYTANNPVNKFDPTGHDTLLEYSVDINEDGDQSYSIKEVGDESAAILDGPQLAGRAKTYYKEALARAEKRLGRPLNDGADEFTVAVARVKSNGVVKERVVYTGLTMYNGPDARIVKEELLAFAREQGTVPIQTAGGPTLHAEVALVRNVRSGETLVDDAVGISNPDGPCAKICQPAFTNLLDEGVNVFIFFFGWF